MQTQGWIVLHYRCDRMVVGFTNTCAVSAEVYSIQHYAISCHCQLLAAGRWFSQSTLVSSTNEKNYCHGTFITEILLKVALNTITLTL